MTFVEQSMRNIILNDFQCCCFIFRMSYFEISQSYIDLYFELDHEGQHWAADTVDEMVAAEVPEEE